MASIDNESRERLAASRRHVENSREARHEDYLYVLYTYARGRTNAGESRHNSAAGGGGGGATALSAAGKQATAITVSKTPRYSQFVDDEGEQGVRLYPQESMTRSMRNSDVFSRRTRVPVANAEPEPDTTINSCYVSNQSSMIKRRAIGR